MSEVEVVKEMALELRQLGQELKEMKTKEKS